ncbi:hypothetical protein Esti_001328 [Eimeria stiedai]
MINVLLGGTKWVCAIGYIDGIIVYSDCWQDHRSHLHPLFAALRVAILQLHQGKCFYRLSQVSPTATASELSLRHPSPYSNTKREGRRRSSRPPPSSGGLKSFAPTSMASSSASALTIRPWNTSLAGSSTVATWSDRPYASKNSNLLSCTNRARRENSRLPLLHARSGDSGSVAIAVQRRAHIAHAEARILRSSVVIVAHLPHPINAPASDADPTDDVEVCLTNDSTVAPPPPPTQRLQEPSQPAAPLHPAAPAPYAGVRNIPLPPARLEFTLEEDILCLIADAGKRSRIVLCVTFCERAIYAHHSHYGGHFGRQKAAQRLWVLYWWPALRRDVRNFLRQ